MKDNVFYKLINKRILFVTALLSIFCVISMYRIYPFISFILAAAGIGVLFIFSEKKIIAGIMSIFILLISFNSYMMLREYELYQNLSMYGTYTLKIISYPEVTDQRIKCVVKSMYDIPEMGIDENDRIFLYLYETDTLTISYGEIYEITGKLSSSPGPTTPGTYDYKSYLLSEGVSFTISAEASDSTYIMSEDLPFAYDKILDLRTRYEQIMDKYMTTTASSLLKGIMFASSQTDSETLGNFRDLGISHVLAVSGLHVGLIYGAIVFIYSLFRIKSRKAKIFFTISANIFIFLYISLSGFSVSCVRAAFLIFMQSISSLSEDLKRRYDTLSALSLISIINMLFCPFVIFSASFILSYLSVVGIIFISPVVMNKIRKTFHADRKLWNYIISPAAISISVCVMISPVSIKLFGETNILGFIYNILMLPAISVCLILGLTAFIFQFLSFAILPVCGYFLGNIIYAARMLSSANSMNMSAGNISLFVFAVYYMTLFSLAGYIHMRKRSTLQLSLTVIIISLAISSYKYLPPKYSSVSFLDVDFGDCALIRTKDNECILIDGGGGFYGGDTANEVILPYLDSIGVRKLTAVIATHSDADHMDGIIGLIGNIDIGSVFANEDGGRLYYVLKDACEKTGTPLYDLYSGDCIRLKDCTINVLSPVIGRKYPSLNDNSIVLDVDLGGVRYLFTGDASKNAEQTVMDISPSFSLDYDILKAPHHGSAFATDEFKLRMFCDVVVISVGNNGYDLPDSEFIRSMENIGTAVLRTDESGLIKISSSGNGEYFITNYMGKWRKIHDTQ